ncbi:MAG: hypothetical protein KAS32_09865, partial [Candidatus Peribacteraceae bacterium]|nr:hypothetical protein [Candidatus Peribacteraceae bacterium]
MKIYKGIIRAQKIEVNRDGPGKVRILTVEVTEPDDTQTVQQVLFMGDDVGAVMGAIAYFAEISEAFKVAIGFDDGIEPTVEAGERKIYS